MTTGKARVVRFRDVQQTLFDERLIEDFQGGSRSEPPDRRRIPIVYGSKRLAGGSDDSGAFCGQEFLSGDSPATDVVDKEPHGSPAPSPEVVAVADGRARASTAKPPATPATPVIRFESAVSTHPRFESTRPQGAQVKFDWRRFALGLLAGTAAGVLLLAVFGSY